MLGFDNHYSSGWVGDCFYFFTFYSQITRFQAEVKFPGWTEYGKNVSRVFQRFFQKVSRGLKKVLRVFHRSLKFVTWLFQRSFLGIFLVFRGSFKGVLKVF